ncbi:MAG TPA: chitin deacetylase [Gammaproteobacteria bacterium]|nr:chitin deacetylase [Gammaproteobacteria bacterium]
MNIKQQIKKRLYQLIAHVGPHNWSYKNPVLLILMYHRVLPKNDSRYALEQPGMLVTPESLDMHLAILKQHFEPVHLKEWLVRKKNGLPLPQKSVAITFDDGWADNYQYAFPLLKKHSIPATIFLVANLIDTNKTFWPERLVSIINTIAKKNTDIFNDDACTWLHELGVQYQFKSVPDMQELDEIITKAKCYTDEEINHLIDQLYNHAETSAETDILTWEQINEMKRTSLVEYGSHTNNHIRMLTDLSQNIIEDEIAGSKKILSAALNSDISLFCYPNGNTTPVAEKIVAENYLAACTTQTGWVKHDTPFHQLPRIGIHDDVSNTNNAFLARLSGWI